MNVLSVQWVLLVFAWYTRWNIETVFLWAFVWFIMVWIRLSWHFWCAVYDCDTWYTFLLSSLGLKTTGLATNPFLINTLYTHVWSVCLSAGLSEVTSAALLSRTDKNKNRNKNAMTSETVTSLPAAESSAPCQPIRVLLRFKRNVFDPRKQMLQ